MLNNVNAIRMLSVDMIEKSNSGHPGICMGAAPTIYTLFTKIMNIDPKNDNWKNRDRFVLSAGHGSAMLYSTLHLSGYDLAIEDLKEFRQLNSKTPGHPEFGHTSGVDATSGPLGQGISQSVGLALAEKHLAAKYNKEDLQLVDNYTYALCGDGDLQEGVSSEASSLAGTLKLGKLIVLWDANEIQLDSKVEVASTEDVLLRYKSYNWQTIEVKDGNDINEIENAIREAQKELNKPTLIKVNTVIGYGSPNKSNSPASHGAPLGEDEVKLVRENFNWDLAPFEISQDIYTSFKSQIEENLTNKKQTVSKIDKEYSEKYPQEYDEYIKTINNDIDYDLELNYEADKTQASRVSSGQSIQDVNNFIPNLIGGSADLSKSNNSTINDSKIFAIDGYDQQNIAFGVREFAMASICNGIMLYGGLKAFCSTFFVFSDYLKPALRMSALQNLGTIYVLTHDSVAVGEDGPTHEPIEQLTGLRAIPNVNIIRPCDKNETSAAWKLAINNHNKPTVLVLTRQNLEVITKPSVFDDFKHGAYVISDQEDFEKVIIATGSEVKLAIDVQELLLEKGIKTRVVSMPCMEVFNEQSEEYKKDIFKGTKKEDRIFIEMSRAIEGYQYADTVISIDSFGLSAPASDVIEALGFTAEKIADKITK